MSQSQVFNLASKLHCRVDFPDKYQTGDDFTDASGVLVAISDTRVWRSRGVDSQVVAIFGKNHPTNSERECDLLFIGRSHQSHFGSSRDINTVAT